jgi:UDP-N-acetylglucosamine 2-epimerase (non-hydrolysing)
MNKLKVVAIVGTRPELIRLSRVLARLDEATDLRLVHTGQNYDPGLNAVFFEELGIRRPDHYLDAAADGASALATIGNSLIRIEPVLREEAPDAVLILGDTNSCLAAIAARRLRIPVFHMEAGNRCFDDRVPEEINRRLVDHIADINLTYSDIAREYLLREGLPPDRVIRTGSPMHEVLHHYLPRIRASDVLDRLGLQPRAYFVVSLHREENVDAPGGAARIAAVLAAVARRYGQRIVFSTHPRTRRRLEAEGIALDPLVELHPPFGFLDYVKLQAEAHAVLSDSGTINEEASILDFPALNLREAHERPEGMEEATVMMTGLAPERVLQALEILASQGRGRIAGLPGPGAAAEGIPRFPAPVPDYHRPAVSEKVLRILLSYTDYVNRVVWRRG